MVAHIVFEVEGWQAACSGALMATRNNSFKPYFLTAAHCVDSEAVARTVEAYWGYQTASCNAARPAGKGTLKSSPGSNLLAAGGFGGGDYALLLLKDVPSGVLFAGWDPGDPGSGSHFTGIHHPRGSYKRISFGTRIADTNVSVDGVPAPGSSFYTVVWNLGATEPGSSGSPAFTSPGIVAGTLSYGLVSPEICNLPVKISGYGRFSLAYPAMQAYLEDLPSSVVSPSPATLDFHGANGTIAAPSRQTVTLTTQSRGAVSFNARADAPWITLSAVSGTVASGSPATLQISIDPTTLKTPRVYTSTVTITAGAAAPQFVTVRLDLRVDRSSVTASVSPNPVTQQEPDPEGARWFFELRLEEKAGVATRLTSIRIDGVDYSTRIADWFGSDRIPALGGIRAGLRMANLYVPSERYFELGGVDDSGQRWSETIVVPFR
ncbi:MAG: BACON domain-containing protein [Acidobacteria bacterium]|nr:BACON domain-containing protein [Acidobacteriota bacterium]